MWPKTAPRRAAGRSTVASRCARSIPSISHQQTIAGVPTRIVTPLTIPADKQNRVLINVHGGGFTADWGSLIETIPIANLTQTKVVAVLYSLAPEHPFPAAVNETVAVYKEAAEDL